jgi:hypothetical protein
MTSVFLVWSSNHGLIGVASALDVAECIAEDTMLRKKNPTIGIQKIDMNDYDENGIFDKSEIDWLG